MLPEFASLLAWPAWALSWFAAAFWSDPAAKRPQLGSQWLYRAVTIVGAFLLFALYRPEFYRSGFEEEVHLWYLPPAAGWALFGVVVFGFLFAWWARLYLGRLWSSSVTRKADHHVVDTGPYALVRHPIYTGLIVAAFATAAERGTYPAIVGAFMLTLGFWIKARLEERFLREQLGADAYDSYRRRVPMLLPFGPKSA